MVAADRREDIVTARSDPSSPLTSRRGLLVGGGAAAVIAGLAAGRWFNMGAEVAGSALSVEAAHQAAVAGTVVLVDIRRPDEWARTGVGAGAQPLDMRREDFIAALLRLTGGPDAPVALICARGVRSRHLAAQLAEAGFGDVRDVPEGMLGSGAGPGWLRKGLPVVEMEDVQS